MYSAENEEESSMIERWNRTIRNKMWKQFKVQDNTKKKIYYHKIVNEYNNTKHSSIKMTPVKASKKSNEGTIFLNLYGDIQQLTSNPKFKFGEKVRISKYKMKTFDASYTPNWTEELFTVNEIKHTNPSTYKINDLTSEDIEGSFYQPGLLKTEQAVFSIDKVIRKDHKKK